MASKTRGNIAAQRDKNLQEGNTGLYKLLVENTSDYVSLLDFSGRYIYTSPSHIQMGYKPDELVGKSGIKMVHPEDRKHILPLLVKFARKLSAAKMSSIFGLKKEAASLHLSFRFPEKSGKWHDLESTPNIVERPGGKGYAILLISRDVTGRRKAEESLRESEGRYRALAESAQDIIFIIGRDGLVNYVNNFAAKQAGHSPHELVGKPPRDFFPRGRFSKQELSLKKVFETGNALYVESILPFLGRDVWLSTRLVPICNDAGAVNSVLGISRDITESKTLEDKIKKDHESILGLIKGLKDGFAVVDKSGRQTLVNDALCSMTGFSEKELLGQMPPFKYWAEEGIKDAFNVLRGAINGAGGTHELIFKRKNGERFIAMVCPRKSVDASGNTMFFATVEDITERKKAEEDLMKFKLGIERSSDAVFITDIEGKINYVNIAFERVYGYAKGEALGKTPRIIKSGMTSKEQYEQFWDALLAKKTMSGEITNKTKSGKLITIDASNNPLLDEKGNVTGFIAVHRDITRRKDAEEELKKKNEELERFNRLAVGRELKMIELKKRIAELEGETKE